MAIRKARGLEVVKSPFQELYEGSRPSLHGLTPAAYLPIVREDKRHEDDPIVIEPGTLVISDPGGSLAVAKGAQIFANGQSGAPIIFTSKADQATWTNGSTDC